MPFNREQAVPPGVLADGDRRGAQHVRERLEKRLNELKAELEAGERLLADITTKQSSLQSSLLRISGAIQVLQEVLASGGDSSRGQPGAIAEAGGSVLPSPRR